MNEVNDWQPVGEDDWQPVEKQPDPYQGMGTGLELNPIPQPFLDRVARGSKFQDAMQRVMKATASSAQEGFGETTPTGISDESLNKLQKWGIYHDPETGRPGAGQFLAEAAMGLPVYALDRLVRAANAGVYGAGGAIGQIYQELGGSETQGNKLRNEAINFANFGMIESGMGRFSRPKYSEETGAVTQSVGALPNETDFKGVAETAKLNEDKLRQLWQEKGVHPDEAAHDAQTDAFLKHDLAKPIELLKDQVDRWQSGMSGNADVSVLPEAVRRLGNPIEQEQKFYRGEWPGRPNLGNESGSISVSDRSGGNSFGLIRNEWALEEDGKIPLSEIIVPEGTQVLDVSKLGGKNADELERMLPPGKYTLVGTREEPYQVGKKIVQQEIKTYRFEPAKYSTQAEIPNGLRSEALEVYREQIQKHSLGAASLDDLPPADVPYSKTPAPIAGKLVDFGRDAMDKTMSLSRNIQFILDPMATGSKQSMVIAKDAMNSVRRVRWEGLRADDNLLRTLTPEQLERGWNAADEESVLRQEGKTSEHMGFATLEPELRAAVDREQAGLQAAWLHAVDEGMVEGEGLPAYTPRMAINVANVGNELGPRSLNELGRNVFTRTAQMRHRGHLTAEETEAAAKSLVERRMKERGASHEEIAAAVERVKLVRNLRIMPIARARLEEAVIWRRMINNVEAAGKAAGEQTVAVGYKPDNSWFTIAGNPAFTKWEPAFEKNPITGKIEARVDDAGKPLMVAKPIYMPPEYRGPMKAILDEGPGSSKLVAAGSSAYEALMAIKGRAMTAILNSPLIHNEVVWSKVAEAAGGREWLGFGLYFRGNRIVNNPGRSGELIERGLNPIGKRGSFQDITAMMEEPNLVPGQSWTAKLVGAIPGLFSEGAEVATRRSIDKMGDFVHNTLLWDRVRDLQFGLADHLSDRLVANGADRITADRVAAHFSNIIVGSIPKEAMSNGARAVANLALFSRSFTLGNISTYKQAALGLPKPIAAQIERDLLHFKLNPETGVYEAPAGLTEEATATATRLSKGVARRKAISTIAMSVGMYYIGNALLQNAFNIISRDSNVTEEMQGYARRYKEFMDDTKHDPFELRHALSRLSPTYDNEPNKQDRAYIGNDKDETGVYVRNPMGKFGEELAGYPTMPMTMARRKASPLLGGILDILENDKGFGRKIYDENDTTVQGDIAIGFAVGKHLVMKHLPEGQISAAIDLLHGEGDPTVNKLRLLGPVLGFTASVGAPGGPARGEQLEAKKEFDARFNLAWPDIKKQIQRGDVDGARDAMDALQVPALMQRGLIRNVENPAAALRGRTLRNFYQISTPTQQRRMDRARSGPLAPEQ